MKHWNKAIIIEYNVVFEKNATTLLPVLFETNEELPVYSRTLESNKWETII